MSGLHELGQGFKIALRDLEIRGAGNLLGVEQHGAIRVGGLRDVPADAAGRGGPAALGRGGVARGRTCSPTPELSVDLPLDHFVPRSYIRDERLRLDGVPAARGCETRPSWRASCAPCATATGRRPRSSATSCTRCGSSSRASASASARLSTDGRDIALKVDPDRVLDVEALERRLRRRLRVRPNRLLLRRQGDGWRDELMGLLDDMAEMYGAAAVRVGNA